MNLWPSNPLPNDKVLDWSKLKVLADDKITVTEKLKFALGRVENIVGKGENAGYKYFLLFLHCFQKVSFPGLLKVGIVRESVNQRNRGYLFFSVKYRNLFHRVNSSK